MSILFEMIGAPMLVIAWLLRTLFLLGAAICVITTIAMGHGLLPAVVFFAVAWLITAGMRAVRQVQA